MSTDAGEGFEFETVEEPAGGGTILRAEDLRVSYGKVTALRGLDLTVEESEIVARTRRCRRRRGRRRCAS